MLLADVVVAGFALVLALIWLVALPCTLFAVFGLVEAFHSGSTVSRLLSCAFFLISAGALAFATYNLTPFVQLSREAWIAASWILAFPVITALLFFLYARFVRRSR